MTGGRHSGRDVFRLCRKWSGNISDVKLATFGSNAAVSHYTFTYDTELQGKHRARTLSAAPPGSMIPAHAKRLRPIAR